MTYCVLVDLPLGESVTAGMECMVGSAMYLKSTGTSLSTRETQVRLPELIQEAE